MSFYSEIIDLILSNDISSKKELHRVKIKLCKKYKLGSVPPDSEIIVNLPVDFSDEEIEKLIGILRKKPMRTISGVAIVAVMTDPHECPHGKCIPCPGGPDSNTPQSYTGHEPAAMRGSLNNFNPYLQVKNRLEQLKAIGHPTDKIDLIIMGGTFPSRTPYYQDWFLKRCFDGMNQKESPNLDIARKTNETAKTRCIGLTVETRPDWFRLQHVDRSLDLGATRVELGVQSVFDDVLFNMNRGHTVSDTIMATRIAKDSGFKICYHMMPGLPGSNDDMDVECFRSIFENSDFKPDMIKIYPTLTIKGTQLYEMWKKKQYAPLDTKQASELIARLKTYVSEWTRIQRIQRDVPSNFIDAGVDKSNLRQYVDIEMKKQNLSCRCIRCREIGHKMLKEKFEIDEENIGLNVTFYDASNSEEIFISLVEENHDAIIGYLRLRDINNSHRSELNQNPCMVIRELKVLGRELSIGKKDKTGWQHKGYGKELVGEAEKICVEEFDKKHLFVLSGVGVKEYYRKLDFKDDGVYLCKKLNG